MTSKEALKIIRYDLLNKKFAFSDKEHKDSYKAIKKDLEALDMFKHALTIVYKPIDNAFVPDKNASIDEFIQSVNGYIIEIKRNELEEKKRKQFTTWIIENIDKDTIQEWLKNR